MVTTRDDVASRTTDAITRFRLDGKVAIVTGGTRGIGLAIAITLARAGAQSLATTTIAQCDGIDIIVNNAATNPVFGPLQQAGHEVFDKNFGVNVKGPLELCRTVHTLTKVMAQEWGADGIRANAICPGLIKTQFSQALWKDEHMANNVLGHQPIHRIGVPDDVAGLALFLASDASSYCTGGVYMVDGGYLT